MTPQRRHELEQAYRQTSYSASTPAGEVRLRIDQPDALLGRLLDVHGVDTFAYLTAANPLSTAFGDEENAIQNEKLARQLAAWGYVFFTGYGAGDDASWAAEPSLLVLGIPQDKALELGKQFRQTAILAGGADGTPRLLWCDS